MLVTQFEVADARRMFPGWDEPAFKAHFKLSAVLPEQVRRGVEYARSVATTPAGAGLKKVQFATSPKMSTYLLALVAGDMEAIHDKAGKTAILRFGPPPASKRSGPTTRSVRRTPTCCRSTTQYFGVDYPLPKLDMIAIPGNYEAGAMENWGAITYIDDALAVRCRKPQPPARVKLFISMWRMKWRINGPAIWSPWPGGTISG